MFSNLRITNIKHQRLPIRCILFADNNRERKKPVVPASSHVLCVFPFCHFALPNLFSSSLSGAARFLPHFLFFVLVVLSSGGSSLRNTLTHFNVFSVIRTSNPYSIMIHMRARVRVTETSSTVARKDQRSGYRTLIF